jgi:hypothetical protein
MTERQDAMRTVLTVRDLIETLKTLPPDLPVYLADWNEEYAEDWPLVEELIHVLPTKVVHGRHSWTEDADAVLFEQPRRLCLGMSTERVTRRGGP